MKPVPSSVLFVRLIPVLLALAPAAATSYEVSPPAPPYLAIGPLDEGALQQPPSTQSSLTSSATGLLAEPDFNKWPRQKYALDSARLDQCFVPPTCSIGQSDRPRHYVAPEGFKRNFSAPIGSLDNPDLLPKALASVAPGSEVFLLGGAYNISGILDLAIGQSVGVHADECTPTIIHSSPTDRAIISAANPEFLRPSSDTWQRVLPADDSRVPTGATIYKAKKRMDELYSPEYLVGGRWGTSFRGLFTSSAGVKLQLIPYPTMMEFAASSERYVPDIDPATGNDLGNLVPYYVGPGLYYDDYGCKKKLFSEGKITEAQAFHTSDWKSHDMWDYFQRHIPNEDSCALWVRLDNTATQVYMQYTANVDPNAQPLDIFTGESFSVYDASNLEIRNIDFDAIANIRFQGNGEANDRLENVQMLDGNINVAGGLEIVSGGSDAPNAVQKMRLAGLAINSGVPPYIYYTDVKAQPSARSGIPSRSGVQGPASAFHVASLLVRDFSNGENYYRPPHCIAIDNNRVKNTWFGIYVSGGDRVSIHHNDVRLAHDDAIMYVSSAVSEFEVAHNHIFESFNGISQVPTGRVPGVIGGANQVDQIWIDHNVVNLSGNSRGRWPTPFVRPAGTSTNGAPGDPDYGFAANYPLFIGHASGDNRPFNAYNNVLVTRGASAGLTTSVHPDDPATYFMNNIVVQQDPKAALIRLVDLSLATRKLGVGTVLDSNQYWRPDSGPEYAGAAAEGCGGQFLDRYSVVGTPMIEFMYGGGSYDSDLCSGSLCSQDACIFRDSSGACVEGRWRYSNYSSLAAFQCGRPVTDVFYEGSRLEQVARSKSWYSLQCKSGYQCSTGFMSNSIFKDPGYDAHYVPAQIMPSKVNLPAALPRNTSGFIGACNSNACELGHAWR